MKPVNWQEVMARDSDLVCDGFTVEDERQFRQLLLKRTLGGKASQPVFLWECADKVRAVVEMVFWRNSEDFTRIEVLLKRRPTNDPVYGDRLGLTGNVELKSHVLPDGSLDRVFEAALAEIGLIYSDLKHATTSTYLPRYAGLRLHDGDRGPVHQTICTWNLRDVMVLEGEWHDIKELPDDIIKEHIGVIKVALRNM